MKAISLLTLMIFLSGCAGTSNKDTEVKYTVFTMTTEPVIGKTLSGQDIKVGGFSGLQFLEEKNGVLYFLTITDRGPNSPAINNDRPFLLPEYSPMFLTIKADPRSGVLSVEKELKLKKKNGEPLSGLPNERKEENPLDIFGLVYSIDESGMDTEGFVSDSEGGWWVAEEYTPSIALFSAEGKLQRRLTPDNELPRQYKTRRTNRGFEAIARNGSKIYAFLQSPLTKDQNHSLIAEFDTETSKTSAEYLYPFEKGNDKIGDAVHLKDNKLLVIEQNGKTNDEAQKAIFMIELGVSDTPVKKKLIIDLAKSPFKNIEKIEGLAVINHHRIALVYDNDFQIAGKTDFQTGLTPLNQVPNQLLLIDFNLESLL